MARASAGHSPAISRRIPNGPLAPQVFGAGEDEIGVIRRPVALDVVVFSGFDHVPELGPSQAHDCTRLPVTGLWGKSGCQNRCESSWPSRSDGRTRGGDGEGRNRTGDTTVFSRVLYQLSYLAESNRV